MSDTSPPKPTGRNFKGLAVLGVAVAGVAIASWVYLGNAASANSCPVQAAQAQIVDAAAVGELAAVNGTGEGRGYADLAFKSADGTEMTLGDFSGKALLVNFWASWCVPCREEMPALDAIAAEYNSDKFQVAQVAKMRGEMALTQNKAEPEALPDAVRKPINGAEVDLLV